MSFTQSGTQSGHWKGRRPCDFTTGKQPSEREFEAQITHGQKQQRFLFSKLLRPSYLLRHMHSQGSGNVTQAITESLATLSHTGCHEAITPTGELSHTVSHTRPVHRASCHSSFQTWWVRVRVWAWVRVRVRDRMRVCSGSRPSTLCQQIRVLASTLSAHLLTAG